MLIATRGESGLDCIPYDDTMLDNATGSYSADPSTSKEKEDEDVITSKFARIGNMGGGSTPSTGSLVGDANQDGVVDVHDATTIQKHLANISKLTGTGLANADANKDGVVDIQDATLIQKYIARLVKTLG